MTPERGDTPTSEFSLGVLMLDTRFPRILGDIGNPGSFDCPVRYRRVAGASPHRVVREAARDLLAPFIEGARILEAEGARAITTSCGFLARFQDELAAAVRVPLFTSSLLLVPLVHRMLPADRAVGIMTVDASALSVEHFAGAGITPEMRVCVAGLETEREFTRVLIGDLPTLDVEAARAEHVTVARRLVAAHPEIGAIVLECTNMPPYGADIRAATGLPVFDIMTLVRMVRSAVECRSVADVSSVLRDRP
ncbi:MAG TPA: aspartate/glutamate racemase family protein [Candidatus Methylomirabilis sp.]|nr:aspartate/glutamate racemase family protein [Candidatus Methylomirabilis sp.]